MNIAINLEEIIKDNNFINIIKNLIDSKDKVYLLIDKELMISKGTEEIKRIVKEMNISFSDILFCDKLEKLPILQLKNISYIIDSQYDKNISSNVPVAQLNVPNEGQKNIHSFTNSIDIYKHIIEYKQKYNLRIKDPITVISGIPSIDKIWNRQYSIDQMNTNLQNMSIYEYVLLNNKDNMDSVALRYFGNTMTFKEMFNKIDEFAKSLKKSGVNEGDTVTICMPNTPEGVIAFFATNKIGAKASMLHPLLKGEDILDTLNKTNSKYMVMADMCHKEVSKIIDQTSIEKVVVVSPADSMPILKGIPAGIKLLYLSKEFVGKTIDKFKYLRLSLVKNFIPKQYSCIKKKVTKEIENLQQNNKSIPYGNLYIKWEDEIKDSKNYTGDISSKYIPNTTAALLRTGGTTGVSKLAALTNENIINNTCQLRDTIPSYKKGDELLAISPIFHGFGLVDSVITALAVNMSVDLHPQYNKSIFIKSLLTNKPTLILGVPTLFKSLIHNPVFDGKDLSFLKVLISGGDTLDASLKEEINKWLKNHGAENPIFSGIGMTEATAAIAFTGLNSKNEISVGYPLPLNNVKIIDPITHEELKYGEVGELCISGPTVMEGYYNNNSETEQTFLDKDKKWLKTGDICYLTENGEICFVDRSKNVIIVSGVNVYSNEIEAILSQIPEIDSCAVVGIPHPYKMNVPKAYIVLRKGITLDEELKNKIMHICNSKLDSYHRIYDIEQIEKIPLTNLNKVKYTELKEMALNSIKETEKKVNQR